MGTICTPISLCTMGFVSHVQCSYQNNFMVDGVESRFMIGEYDAV